jgi:hypothetical protein
MQAPHGCPAHSRLRPARCTDCVHACLICLQGLGSSCHMVLLMAAAPELGTLNLAHWVVLLVNSHACLEF